MNQKGFIRSVLIGVVIIFVGAGVYLFIYKAIVSKLNFPPKASPATQITTNITPSSTISPTTQPSPTSSPRNSKVQELPCPEISTFFINKFFTFVSPALATPPSSPFQATPCILGKPIKQKEIQLVYKLKSLSSAPNVIAKVELPNDLALISGELEWKGSLEANIEHEIKLLIFPTKSGNYQIKVAAESEGIGYRYGDNDVIELEVK